MIKCLDVHSSFRKKCTGSFKEHVVSPEFNFAICQNSYQKHTYDTDYFGLIKFSTWSDELLIDYYRLL